MPLSTPRCKRNRNSAPALVDRPLAPMTRAATGRRNVAA
ncbi:hypothetical protein C7S14_4408 [Burkholderia cepacia]|nr:hypothetical protein C7S14_4408 [Burkholderia cepacia]